MLLITIAKYKEKDGRLFCAYQVSLYIFLFINSIIFIFEQAVWKCISWCSRSSDYTTSRESRSKANFTKTKRWNQRWHIDSLFGRYFELSYWNFSIIWPLYLIYEQKPRTPLMNCTDDNLNIMKLFVFVFSYHCHG